MTGFGDIEPEDAWHPDDPSVVLIANLRRRLDLLDLSLVDPLDAIEDRLAAYLRRRAGMNARDQLRIDQLRDDLGFLRSRR